MAELILRQGETLPLVLRYGEAAPQAPETYLSAEKLKRTEDYWKGLARACTYRGPWREMVERSYLALHLLLYAPTGAIVAAPTTSLPEEIGGERNWDYRFTWLRDSSFVLNAFFSLGHAEEAEGFMNWLSTLCDRCGATAQILYAVDFEQNLQEEVLSHLSGYRGSRPVRIGNGAYRQLQLDVFGEVLSSAYMYLTQGGEISPRIWGLLESFVEAAAENWRRPDSGIWEVRSGPYHFVHSKVMCWVALDRGIRIAARLGYGGDLERWRRIAEEIRQDILTRGWKEQKQAFTQHYESEALDASNLLMPLFGFLPATDERMKSTIERSMAELTWRGLVRRYNTEEVDDGLTGGEAAFALCTFWLIRNLIRLGRLSEARALYERMLGYANHLGLFAEMVQPETGELLGNFPQAFTHVAVIITGLELTRALSRENQL
jgi:GH15 family glucan-1,4-alpha-glucosidase